MLSLLRVDHLPENGHPLEKRDHLRAGTRQPRVWQEENEKKKGRGKKAKQVLFFF